MKTYQNYKDIPEYIQAEAELNKVQAAINEATEVMRKNAVSMIGAVNRLQGELDQAKATLDNERTQLVAEEMRGKSTLETVQKVKAAEAEVERISSTMEAFSRTGGSAVFVFDKKLKELKNKRAEFEWMKSPTLPWKVKKELSAKIDSLNAEIEPLENSLSLLMAKQAKHGQLISSDADTVQMAQKAFLIAAEAWAVRAKLKQSLLEQTEATKAEIERLQISAMALQTALQNVDPDSCGEYIAGSDIARAGMPGEYRVGCHERQAKYRVKSEIRRLGQLIG